MDKKSAQKQAKAKAASSRQGKASEPETNSKGPPPRPSQPPMRPDQPPTQQQPKPQETEKAKEGNFFSTLDWEDEQSAKEKEAAKGTVEGESLLDDDDDDDEFGAFWAERLQSKSPAQNGNAAQEVKEENVDFFAASYGGKQESNEGDLFGSNFGSQQPSNNASGSDGIDLLNIGSGQNQKQSAGAAENLMDAGAPAPTNFDLLSGTATTESAQSSSGGGGFGNDLFDPFQQRARTPSPAPVVQEKPPQESSEDLFDPFGSKSAETKENSTTQSDKKVNFTVGTGAGSDNLFDPFSGSGSGSSGNQQQQGGLDPFGGSRQPRNRSPSPVRARPKTSGASSTTDDLFDPFGGSSGQSPSHLAAPNLGGMAKQSHSQENLLGDFSNFGGASQPTLKQVK